MYHCLREEESNTKKIPKRYRSVEDLFCIIDKSNLRRGTNVQISVLLVFSSFFFFLSIFPPIPISKLWITVGRKMSFSINSNISVVCRNGCIFLMLASMFVIKKITNQTPMTSSPLLTPASKNDLTKPWYAISDTKRETKNELVLKQQLFESTF